MEELTSTVTQNATTPCRPTAGAVRLGSGAQGRRRGGAGGRHHGSINASSRKIVDIIGVIDGIAFQTNILALNAAVEAARGASRGAASPSWSEVRNLAQRSAARPRKSRN
jgi:hypothetical protein